nr:Ig-like domain-containing protein [Lysinibacter cavernae]
MKGGSTIASTTTNAAGAFSLLSIPDLAKGDYTLAISAPSGRDLVASPLNNGAVFSGATLPGEDAEYQLVALHPGTGAAGIALYYTDTAAPVATEPALSGGVTVASLRYNPQSAALAGSDVGTTITGYTWTVLDAAAASVATGTAVAGSDGTQRITLPGSLADGAYTLSVTATDLVGNVSAPAISGYAIDRTAPVLSGETSVTFAKGDEPAPTGSQGWIDLFAVTAQDGGSGLPVSDGITVDASSVDQTVAGTYTVTFTATDAAGNTSTAFEAEYVVAYVADPTIVLGATTAFHELGSATPTDEAAVKTLFGGVTTAASGGASVASVTVSTGDVEYSVLGSYPVVFTVTDSLGYTAEVTGTLTVRDTIAPQISVTTESITYVEGDAQLTDNAAMIAAFGAVATDSGSGIASFSVDAAAVDYNRAGAYAVTFTATDSAGNTATQTVTYTVAFAGSPSVLLGNTPATYEMGDTLPANSAEWVELFEATASTAPGTTLVSLTANSSAVDATTPTAAGYVVRFTATDSYGNTFTADGMLVVADTKAPTATLGTASATHAQREPETPFGVADWLALFAVTAKDTTGGSGINQDGWAVTAGVNFAVAGEYPVEFVATDMAGNVSATVTATLTIQAPPTDAAVSLSVAQDSGVALDPSARSSTTGTFAKLTTADLQAPSARGSVELDNRGGVTYTPARDFSGQETLVVTVTDDLGQTATVTYTLTVVRKGKLITEFLPEYAVPVDGAVSIPVADVQRAVDVVGLSVDEITTPDGFAGTVTLDGDTVKFVTDGTMWHGDESFNVSLKDGLGQVTTVPVSMHVLAPAIALDRVTGYAGTTEVTVTASGLVAGNKYGVELHSTPLVLGSITADAAGSGQLTTSIPADAEVGSHTIVLVNDKQQHRGSLAFDVLPVNDYSTGDKTVVDGMGDSTVDTGALSITGSGVMSVAVWFGLVLLIAGLLALLAVRRREHTADRSGQQEERWG